MDTEKMNRDPDEELLGRLKEKLGLRKLIGQSAAFQAEVKKIPLIARCDANVLIAGETGTGKEIFARCIHYLSLRAPRPFIPVSCGAIPSDLFENELFGHERGAFTGAMTANTGLIQEAEGGTLFLDDIDCIPLGAQTKVLRFLQEKEFRPLGSTRTQHSDTRIIASTNTDLGRAVSQDVFRRDLFYRLNVISIALPALEGSGSGYSFVGTAFHRKIPRRIRSEEQRDLFRRASEADELRLAGKRSRIGKHYRTCGGFLHQAANRYRGHFLPESDACAEAKAFKEAKSQAVTRFEKKYIQNLLSTHQGNISQSAKAAHKDRRAFWELIRKHKIDARNYKIA